MTKSFSPLYNEQFRSESRKQPMDIQINMATIEDAPGISDLLRSLELFAYLQKEKPQTTRHRVLSHLKLCRADHSHSIYAARNSSGQMIGYCAVHWLPYLMLDGPEGYISELFLRESFRGRGIGRQLLETVKTEARQRGCSRLMLLNLSHRESYKRGFYKKQGWEERPEAVNFVLKI
jgi:GNAT superfamily N-acetyltransferase